MNWLDIILLVVLIKSALQGFLRGFVLSAFKTAGVLVALFMGIFYRDEAVSLLKTKLAMDKYISSIIISPAIKEYSALEVMNVKNILDLLLAAMGFLLIFLLVQLIFLIPAYFINGIIKLSRLTLLDRLMGRCLVWPGRPYGLHFECCNLSLFVALSRQHPRKGDRLFLYFK